MPDQPEFTRDDPDFEGQDQAEVWDEDNQDTDERRMATDDDALEPDDLPDVYDATRRVGDEDDDDAVIGDDLDDEDIVELSLDDEDEGYNDDDPDAEPDEDGEADADGVVRLSPDEIELLDGGDLANTQGALGSAKRFESARLSDADIEQLGYGPQSRSFEPKSAAGDGRAKAPSPSEAALDDSVEATFPASDPVAPRHIT
jgi:hypothetical protein